MRDLIEKIDNVFNNGMRVMVAVGVLYFGGMVVEYSIIERSQRDVMRYKSEPVAQVDFKHFYNPVEFWQDNVNLIQEDNKLRKENSEFSSNFGIPTTG